MDVSALISKLLPDPVFDLIIEKTEKRRKTLLASKLFPINRSPPKPSQIDYRWKQAILTPELKQYFGWTWLWESKHPSFSYKKFRKEMDLHPPCDDYDDLKMTVKRYFVISQCLDADILSLCDLLSEFQMKGLLLMKQSLGSLGRGSLRSTSRANPPLRV
jgi:hypothetical protein